MTPGGETGPEEDIEALLEQLSDDETRRLLLDLAARHDDAATFIRRASASPPGRVALLRADLDELQTRRHLGYRESIEWARDAAPVVDDIAAEARSSPSRELLKLVELALNRVIKVIHHADDSSGMIGDLAHQLLHAHAEACDAGVADPKALARWMVRFGFDDQDFFNPDPVRYAAALGEKGLAAFREVVDDRSAGRDPDFAVRYARERLTVLDGDTDGIVSLLGGDLTKPCQFIRVAEAMLELDRVDDALSWATRGIESTSGRQVAKLYDIAADVFAARADQAGVLALRREQHQRMPSSTTYATLRRVASMTGMWEAEQSGARDRLAAYDVGGFVDALLAEGDVETAWAAATAADTELGDDRWNRLAKLREPDDPSAAMDVYLRLVDSALMTADRSAYRAATKLLKHAHRAATTAGRSDGFDAYVAGLREQYRRRPTLTATLDKAGLQGAPRPSSGPGAQSRARRRNSSNRGTVNAVSPWAGL